MGRVKERIQAVVAEINKSSFSARNNTDVTLHDKACISIGELVLSSPNQLSIMCECVIDIRYSRGGVHILNITNTGVPLHLVTEFLSLIDTHGLKTSMPAKVMCKLADSAERIADSRIRTHRNAPVWQAIIEAFNGKRSWK